MADIVDMGGRSSSKAAQPNRSVIDFLEKLLTQARDGQVQHIIACWLDANGIPTDAYAGGGHPMEIVPLIGSMELCKHTILAQMKDA